MFRLIGGRREKNILVIESNNIEKNRKIPVSDQYGQLVAMLYDDLSADEIEFTQIDSANPIMIDSSSSVVPKL